MSKEKIKKIFRDPDFIGVAIVCMLLCGFAAHFLP